MAIDQKLIDRINELARIKKERELTEEEKEEQGILRAKYIEGFKENFKSTLNIIDVVDEVIIKDRTIDEVEKKLFNVKGIKKIQQVKRNVVVTYVCKEIEPEEILKKAKTSDKVL